MNRGAEKRKIFLDDEDYFRFRDDLYDFNTKKLNLMSHYDRQKSNTALRGPCDELVDVLGVCLMPNHYHLLAQEKVDGGAGLFSSKISNGYTQSFNLKYERSGFLFQGRTKKILVEKDEHFIHLPYYIFSNPIKLIEPKWKEYGLKDKKRALKFLSDYQWSSFSETVLNKGSTFSKVINKKLFYKLFDFDDGKQFEKFFMEWL